MKISCFMPMFNEEANVEKVVGQAIAALSPWANEFEIIIVNDGSTDQTARLVEKLAKADPRVKLVSHARNLGYGAALRSGYAACRYDLIFQTDGDGQFDLSEIDRLLPYINDHDFVIGYRIKRRDPFYRNLEAGFYRIGLVLLFGLNLRDANCAFKLLKKDIIGRLPLKTSGALINGEIFIKARALGYSKIKEVGIDHYPRRAGKQTGAKLRVLWNALVDILGLWARYLTGKL